MRPPVNQDQYSLRVWCRGLIMCVQPCFRLLADVCDLFACQLSGQAFKQRLAVLIAFRQR